MRLTNLAISAPRLAALTPDQMDSIHQGALVLLQRTGVKFQHEQAQQLLQEAGAHLQDGRIHMTPSMVEAALRQTPSSVQFYGRTGRLAMTVDNQHLFLGSVVTPLNIIDGVTQSRSRLTVRGVADMAKLADYLPHIDYVGSGPPGDVHADVSDVIQFQAAVTNTVKPVSLSAFSESSLRTILNMCAVVAGSEEAFQRKPFLISPVLSDTPLQFSKVAVDRLIVSAENAVPTSLNSFPVGGAGAPVTLAGILTLGWAESLAALVLCQRVRPGCPCLIRGSRTIMDMSTGNTTWGSPERAILGTAMGNLTRYFRIPGGGGGVGTDSKAVDAQAATEVTLTTLTSALHGHGLIGGVGDLESSLSYSHEMLVLGNEIIGMVKRCLQGIAVNDETLALDVIDAVGPGGNFIEQAHTLRHFKEHWRPRLMDRRTYQGWMEAGAPSLVQRLHQEVEHILAEHVPEPLPEDVERELANIIARETQRVAQ